MSYPRNIPINDTQMLHFYIDQHNETTNRIQQLYRNLDQINANINRLYFTGSNNINNINNINNTNYNHYSRNIRNRNQNRRPTSSHNHVNYTQPLRNSVPVPIINANTNYTNRHDVNNQVDNMFSFLTDVPVFPSTQQILRATRLIRFDTIHNPLNESCPISLERFSEEDVVTQILFCGHIFNTEQLDNWFSGNVRCPVCRYDIRSNIPEQEEKEEEEKEGEEERITPNNTLERITEQLLHIIQDDIESSRVYFDASNNSLFFETTLYYPDVTDNN